MKNNKYVLSTLLVAVVGVALTVCVLLKTFLPAIILPKLGIPSMVALSLLALYLDYRFVPGAKRCWICTAVFGLLSFGLLPYAASFVGGLEAVKLGLVGCVVFTVTTWLYTSILSRIASAPANPIAKQAPFISAVALYLASQCFMGIL